MIDRTPSDPAGTILRGSLALKHAVGAHSPQRALREGAATTACANSAQSATTAYRFHRGRAAAVCLGERLLCPMAL
jgi:hypothetical protein